MMDQMPSSGPNSTSNLHPSSSQTSSSASSVIVQQSSASSTAASLLSNNNNNNPVGSQHLGSLSTNSELDSLSNILLASNSAPNAAVGHSSSSSSAEVIRSLGTSQELTPVQQQRIISTTQQHLSTPTGPGSNQSPVLSPPGKVFGRNYNGTSKYETFHWIEFAICDTNGIERKYQIVIHRLSLIVQLFYWATRAMTKPSNISHRLQAVCKG